MNLNFFLGISISSWAILNFVLDDSKIRPGGSQFRPPGPNWISISSSRSELSRSSISSSRSELNLNFVIQVRYGLIWIRTHSLGSQFLPGESQFRPGEFSISSWTILNFALEDLNFVLQVRIGFQFRPRGPNGENADFVLRVRSGFRFRPPGPK